MAIITRCLFSAGYEHYLSLLLGNGWLKIPPGTDEGWGTEQPNLQPPRFPLDCLYGPIPARGSDHCRL